MKPALAVFNSGIDQLTSFLETSASEQKLFSRLNDRKATLPPDEGALLEQVVASSTHARQYIYAVAIVSLYGLLERLVDALIVQFVSQVSSLSGTYERLPDKIRSQHLPQSILLVDALLKDRFRSETTAEEVIANLHSCLAGHSSYKLNGFAFSLHRGNINVSKINEMLNGVGAQHHVTRIVRTPSFGEFLRKLNLERDLSSITSGETQRLLDPLDELVERRNEISHGVIEVANIESVELLKGRCAFIRAYGAGLHEMLFQELLKYLSEIGVAQRLGRPIAVYNNRIVCFETSGNLAVGDQIFAVTAEAIEPIRCSSVKSIEIDHVRQEAIATETPVRFGVEVGFYAVDGHDYFSVAAEKI